MIKIKKFNILQVINIFLNKYQQIYINTNLKKLINIQL